MSYNHMAELSREPARRYGVLQKGDIAPGYDADLVLVDPRESFVVRATESESKQGYTPFEGMELTGRVKSTFLRGELVYDQGKVVGPPRGRYIRRPTRGIAAMSTWSDALYDTLLDAGVRQVAYVPDAGHKRLIELALANPELKTTVLTTEEEGAAPRRRAPRRPARRAPPAIERVGNCINMLSLAAGMPRPAADAGDDARRVERVQPVAGDDGPGDAGGARGDGDDRAARRRGGTDRRNGPRRVGARVRFRRMVAVLIGQRAIGAKAPCK